MVLGQIKPVNNFFCNSKLQPDRANVLCAPALEGLSSPTVRRNIIFTEQLTEWYFNWGQIVTFDGILRNGDLLVVFSGSNIFSMLQN